MRIGLPGGVCQAGSRIEFSGKCSGEANMTRQRWLKSRFTCELKSVRHLENRIVFCNDCLASRTLWVSASGTLDCSACGSQNWMHLAVPLVNRPKLALYGSDAAATAKRPGALTLDPRSLIVPQVRHEDREFVKRRPHPVTLENLTLAATHFVGWADSCSSAAVQSLREISGQFRPAFSWILLRMQQALRDLSCSIRSWLAPAKQA